MTIATSRAVLVAPGVVAVILGPGTTSRENVSITSSNFLISPRVIISSPDGIYCVNPDMLMRNRYFSQRHGFVALLNRVTAERVLAWSELLVHSRRPKVQ